MQLFSLEVYIAILEFGSFAQTAKFEHMTQPAISTIISNLEKEVGYKLLERSSGQRKRIEPTPAGRIFAEFAKQTLNNYNNTRLQIAEHADDLQPLKILVSASPGVSVYPQLVSYFTKLYPHIQVVTSRAKSARDIFTPVVSGDVSLCVSGSAAKDSRLVSQPFFYDPPVLVCSSEANIKETISSKELRTLPFIHRPENLSNFSRLVLKSLEEKGVHKEDLHIIMEVSGDADVFHAISLSGEGVGFISHSLYETSGASAGLRKIDIRGLRIDRYLYITYRKDRSIPIAAQLFIDCAKQGDWTRGIFT